MKLIIDVDINNPIHHAEGTDYLMPDIHEFISENMLKILKERGKVLPQCHGRLIDADDLLFELSSEHIGGLTSIMQYDSKDTWTAGLHTAWRLIESAPTIVEAENEDKK